MSETSLSFLPIAIDSSSTKTMYHHDTFNMEINENEMKMLFKKKRIIIELIVTEENYKNDLFVIEKIYKKKAIEYSVLSQEDMKIIFCNIYDIWQFTNKFSKLLKTAGKNMLETNIESNTDLKYSKILFNKLSDTWIGKAFSQMIPQIEKIYSIYCINHDISSQRLQKLEQNLNIQKWLEECKKISKEKTNAWDLASLLIKPVQRIFKYPLLLIQIIDATSPNHPDIMLLNHANKEITLVIDRINEIKRCKDMVKHVISGRTDNSIRHVIVKGISRKTEKLKKTVGLIETYHDIFYEKLFEKFRRQQIQISTFKKKIKNWFKELTNYLLHQSDLAFACSSCMITGKKSFSEIQKKWKEYKTFIDKASKDGLCELEKNLTYFVFKPLKLLKNLYKIPSSIIKKRNTKILDYIHIKTLKKKGIMPNKALVQSAEIYNVINAQLKKELPDFLHYTSELFNEIIIRLSYCQQQWYKFWILILKNCLKNYDPLIDFNNISDIFSKKNVTIKTLF